MFSIWFGFSALLWYFLMNMVWCLFSSHLGCYLCRSDGAARVWISRCNRRGIIGRWWWLNVSRFRWDSRTRTRRGRWSSRRCWSWSTRGRARPTITASALSSCRRTAATRHSSRRSRTTSSGPSTLASSTRRVARPPPAPPPLIIDS